MRALIFAGKKYKAEIRYLRDLSQVIYDKKWFSSQDQNQEIYYMFRNLYRGEDDKKLMEKLGIRYDITIIPPKLLGNEYVKTLGHYHPELINGLTYPEIYHVLEGEVHYFIQKPLAKNFSIIDKAILIKAKAPDVVIIPPNYGHITINPSSKILKMANFVSCKFSSIYEPIIKLGGACYFELVNGKFVRNENYEQVPELEIFEAKELAEEFSNKVQELEELFLEKDIYGLLSKNPKVLSFLNEPRRLKDVL